jgi:predicted dehydrogenase
MPTLSKIPQVEFVGIGSAGGLTAQHAARRFGFGYACTREEQIIDDPSVNTVAILTRHHLHARQVLAAYKAGKHVFCEKPLAISQVELDEISQMVQDNAEGENDPTSLGSAPLLMVGFNRRFAPLAERLYSFFSGQREPIMINYRVNAGYLPPSHWLHDPEQGGGRIIGEACHFIDFLAFLVGNTPLSVSAQALPDNGVYREDNVVMTFSFPDGSLGTIEYLANGDRAFPKERVEVFAGGRVGVLDDFRTLELVRDGRKSVYRSRFQQDKGHKAEWEAFKSAILSGGAPPIPYEHIFGVTQATFAAVEALRSGKKVRCDSSLVT